jgi:hypothetical protein
MGGNHTHDPLTPLTYSCKQAYDTKLHIHAQYNTQVTHTGTPDAILWTPHPHQSGHPSQSRSHTFPTLVQSRQYNELYSVTLHNNSSHFKFR